MPIDRNALLALWKLEDIPACDEGMMLAEAFLESCGEGVNRLGIEEPADRIADITAMLHGACRARRGLRQVQRPLRRFL
jgi:hypothetical protein